MLTKIKNLINIENLSYYDSKLNSKAIDDLLEFNISKIEEEIFIENKYSMNSTWNHLDSQAFQTPYTEILEMLKAISPKENDIWIDIGAGYGRMGIVSFIMNYNIQFLGLELVNNRVIEGNRILKKWNITNSQLLCVNASDKDFLLPNGNLYFIYDYGSKDEIYKTINQIKNLMINNKIKIIARGKGVRHYLITDFPWLNATHYENWSVFSN